MALKHLASLKELNFPEWDDRLGSKKVRGIVNQLRQFQALEIINIRGTKSSFPYSFGGNAFKSESNIRLQQKLQDIVDAMVVAREKKAVASGS